MTNYQNSMNVALAWCLAWGEKRQPQVDLSVLQQMREAVEHGTEVPATTKEIVAQVEQLQQLSFPENLTQIQDEYPNLWDQKSRIGLVYGGATKIKQYVFEAANLQDIRGASALLDQINLVDLPAFFGKVKAPQVSRWLEQKFPGLKDALIPELIIYSTGGNILAFCPAAFVDDLANAIEKRYTEETLTANSCAVGDTFRLLEIRFGLLKDPIKDTLWLDWYEKYYKHHLVEAYYGKVEDNADSEELTKRLKEKFKERKSFNELAGKLASMFQQRRNGNDIPNVARTSRRYPPMFETHPHIVRDSNQNRSAIIQTNLPDEPWFSDALARKRITGQQAKREGSEGQQWYYGKPAFRYQFDQSLTWWHPGEVESWVAKFEEFLKREGLDRKYYQNVPGNKDVTEALRTGEIGNASNDFIAFIYADGNNMGGYIQKIQSPQQYAEFSKDIFCATEQSVYHALAEHLHPHELQNLKETDSKHREGLWVHPFEIITIGGDDVMLIVPANKALAIAHTIGEEFEKILVEKETYRLDDKEAALSVNSHRYVGEEAQPSRCKLSMSAGVLITSYNTPIYYAENLTNQLLKSAKKLAKELKSNSFCNYHGGTVDFLTLKSVTMISSKIQEFREEGLTKQGKPKLKLYAAPYTLHELNGLIKTVGALKKSEFPRSQLYQIRSLLERGKNTAILNYRYFRVRLKAENQQRLTSYFENAWCQAKTNDGNLAPWMFSNVNLMYRNLLLIAFCEMLPKDLFKQKYIVLKMLKSTYETIWREMVDLYPFIEEFVEEEQPAEVKS